MAKKISQLAGLNDGPLYHAVKNYKYRMIPLHQAGHPISTRIMTSRSPKSSQQDDTQDGSSINAWSMPAQPMLGLLLQVQDDTLHQAGHPISTRIMTSRSPKSSQQDDTQNLPRFARLSHPLFLPISSSSSQTFLHLAPFHLLSDTPNPISPQFIIQLRV
jgi:hypothetical protein